MKFQQLCSSHFTEEVDRNYAAEKGTQLVRLMQFVYKPITQSDLERVLQRRKDIGIDAP